MRRSGKRPRKHPAVTPSAQPQNAGQHPRNEQQAQGIGQALSDDLEHRLAVEQ